jgi:LPS export ABC transporter protein LptC
VAFSFDIDILKRMQGLSVKNMRRFLIGVIILILIALLFNYLQTRRKRIRAVNPAPQILSSEMKSSAEGIEHSEYRNGVVRFKISARQLLESREGKKLLQGIAAHDFNPDGSIRNEIRSRNAEYDPDRKIADFSGDVHLFIGKQIEVRTDSLHYDLNSELGTTPDLLRVYSDQVRGTARGLRFDQNQKMMALSSAVDLTLTQNVKRGDHGTKAENLHATSERAYCSELTDRILFQGRARIESESQTLSGESIEAVLDSDHKCLKSLTAVGNAVYEETKASNEKQSLGGDRMVFEISSEGVLQKIKVSGQASYSSISSSDERKLRGGEIDMELDDNQLPSQVQSRTGVSFTMKRETEQIVISGEQLDARFTAGTKYLESIQVRDHARMSTAGNANSEESDLQADDIRMSLHEVNGRSALQKIRAEGSARYISKPARKNGMRPEPARSLSAALLELFQSDEKDYFESGSASGKVIISEDSNDGTNRVQVKRLLADKARFHFYPENNQIKDLNAEGHVQIDYEKKAASGKSPDIEEFRTASDQMSAAFTLDAGHSVAESVAQWGNFTYSDGTRSASSGRCDYDAGKEVLLLTQSPKISDDTKSTTGKLIDYDRKSKLLSVHGQVVSLLSSQSGTGSFFGTSSSSSPGVVKADEMLYWTDTGRAQYTGKVHMVSENQHLQADTLNISSGLEQVSAQGSVLHRILKDFSNADASKQSKPKQVQATADAPTTIQSSTMQYLKKDNLLRYSGKVTLHSKDMDLSSDNLDAILDPDGKPKHLTARNNVAVNIGDSKGKGDVADYYTEPEKYIELTGKPGKPAEFYEPGRGRSFAHRLKYFDADGRILLGND